MGRARHPGAARPRRRGPAGRAPRQLLLTSRVALASLLAAALLSCETVGVDLDAVVAIEVSLPDSAVVEEGDTIFPRARALNGYGDSVAATIVWATLDTASLLVLDSLTGASQGKKPAASARLQARVGALLSNSLALAVRAQADTLFAPGAFRDTVDASASVDSLSDSLIVRLQADTGGILFDLAGRRVLFQIIYPAGAGAFTLQPQDTVLTAASGRAAVRTRLVNRPLPDSVVVEARALRANGQTVPGSPVTFVVEYVP